MRAKKEKSRKGKESMGMSYSPPGGHQHPNRWAMITQGVFTDLREQCHIVTSCMLFNIISSNIEETPEETCGKSMRLKVALAQICHSFYQAVF